MASRDDMAWPVLTAACRPWTRWWWLGSAVSEAEITRHLQRFRDAGLGGVEVSPIYGVSDESETARYVPFLSPRWVELLGHTLREAKRLGLGVDMITGTGWPFGGPWVPDADAPARLLFETFVPDTKTGRVEAPVRSKSKPAAQLLVLMAYPPGDGRALWLREISRARTLPRR